MKAIVVKILPLHRSSVENLFAICITARRKRGEREGEGEDEGGWKRKRQVKMAMKVKKAVVGRVRMLERPPRSDEGQLGQSIPQPVVAAAIERASRTAKREERWVQGLVQG